MFGERSLALFRVRICCSHWLVWVVGLLISWPPEAAAGAAGGSALPLPGEQPGMIRRGLDPDGFLHDPAGQILSPKHWAVRTGGGVLALLLATGCVFYLFNRRLTAETRERRRAEEAAARLNRALENSLIEIDEQRRQFIENDRLKSAFLMNMSHELRTPLNSLLALAQLMLSRDPGGRPDDETEFLRVIERNGHRLLQLVNDILDLSRIEADRLDLFPSEFSPRDAALKAASVIRPMAEAKGLALEVVAGDLPRMHSDESRVGQILLNLLSNAVKFTEKGGITLTVARAGDRVCFSVVDTGIGISEEAQRHVFDMFRQEDSSPTRRRCGAGLGLAISQKVAGLLGGRVTVQSRAGRGSTFTLTLPLRQTWPQDPQSPSPTEREGDDLPRVEDPPRRKATEEDPVGARYVSGKALRSNGLRSPEALDGRSGDPERKETDCTDAVLGGEDLAAPPPAPPPADPGRSMDGVCIPGAASAPPKRGSPLILIVEDNPDNLFTVKAILDETRCTYVAVEDGEGAVTAAARILPDLILMDVQLPGMDGLEATRCINDLPELRNTPIIALTARAMTGQREEILAAGCDGYLAKPLHPEKMVEMVEKWTRGTRRGGPVAGKDDTTGAGGRGSEEAGAKEG